MIVSLLLYGVGLLLVAMVIYVFVVLPFKLLMAFTAWGDAKRKRQAEREYYRLPEILGGDGN